MPAEPQTTEPIMILLTTGLLVLIACLLAYYWLLAAVASLPDRQPQAAPGKAEHRFGIVIPAHNEETVILEVIKSCQALDYPAEQFAIIVIADNCSDHTAEIARAAGALVLERHDPIARGKGYALQWAFDRVLPLGFDALVVLDADCWIDAQALRAFDRELSAGNSVLQASYVVANPDENALSYALAVGNLIENDLFYAPKSRLGLAVFLRGTGMVFRREILERHPWTAHSVTEDVEYAMTLREHGIAVRFLPAVRVFSSFPVTDSQLGVQRRRWGAGTVGAIRVHALRMMARGFRKRDPALLDCGITLLVAGRSLLPAFTMLGLIMALLARVVQPGRGSAWLLGAAGIEVVLMVCYFALGIARLGLNRRRLQFLATIPIIMARISWAAIQGLSAIDRRAWRRTPRTGDLVRGSR
jgi:1,2-diacylglycerol 3-beta-glucosyltransferase